MKTTKIIQTVGFTFLMGLTSVTMANAQNNRGRSSNDVPVKQKTYKINDRMSRSTQVAPAKVYQNNTKTRTQTTGRVATANHSKGQQDKYQKTHAKPSYNKQKSHHTGSAHTSWNYGYTNHPVHHTNYHYGNFNQHREPHLTVNLPHGFFGLTVDGIRYFHHDGYFYRHHPHGGYVMTTLPKYFRHIPAGSVRIVIDGRVYYQYKALVFKHTAFGFRLA